MVMLPRLSYAVTNAYPPKPEFTENEVPQLNGKVYIVTGANTGVGKEVAKILYSKDAKVYVAARSKEKASTAIDEIKEAVPKSMGELVFLPLDLADLSTIKSSTQEFLSKESKLHVLFNNAGVMNPPQGSKTAQNYELQLGVNNLGTFLFTKLLTPTLVATAKTEPPSSVRVVWVSSSAADGLSPPDGVTMDNLDYHEEKSGMQKYAVSKAGNLFQATEYAKRYRKDGVVSVPLNPGNLDSDLYRNVQGALVGTIIRTLFLHPSVYGAYTELYAGLSPQVTIEKSGEWVVPWGRHVKMIRKDIIAATKSEAEGGSGVAQRFWEFNEDQVKSYL